MVKLLFENNILAQYQLNNKLKIKNISIHYDQSCEFIHKQGHKMRLQYYTLNNSAENSKTWENVQNKVMRSNWMNSQFCLTQ